MRGLYEGYAEALSRYLYMPLPPWIADQPHKDNWLAVSKLRSRTEAANPPIANVAGSTSASTLATLIDEHHDF